MSPCPCDRKPDFDKRRNPCLVTGGACCEECAYPGNPGVCVRQQCCPCHDTEEDQ